MESKPTTSSGYEESIDRRHTLYKLAKVAAGLLAFQIATVFRPFSAAITQALTENSKGEEMNHDRSHALDDPYRLPRNVLPTRYDLRLEPDLASATFQGRVTIAVTVIQPTNVIVLNALDLTIENAALEAEHGQDLSTSIHMDESLQRCRLTFPQPLTPGAWRLGMTFRGTLNDALRGFYRSTYKDQHGMTQTMAATQFEATDARRAFPCWDEPDFKAVFSTTLVIDKALTAVSNSAVASETLEGEKKVVRFVDTIKMSTYLVAFIVGQIEPSDVTFVGKTPLRLWAVPGKSHLTGFGRDIAKASLQFFENYYGITYPGDKLDLLAIPDFASGAMENLGAITFRETALLVDERTGTHGELQRIADVVAHENAHMWFGDLVTMSWWNGLWLNEAFATFMEMLAVDAWKPEWKRWDTFSVSRAAAFSVDGLHSTRPIEYPVRAPKDAEAMFDVLTYEKGASVLRMLEQHIGPTVFRDGVRDYLHAHAYGNADTKDLWVSLGKAADQPVPDLMDGWIFQPGHPLVTAELNDQSQLVLTQHRFTYLPNPSPATWHVPVQLRTITKNKQETCRLLLTEKEATLALPPDVEYAVINEGGHGFYRVHYGPAIFKRLLDGGLDKLAATERFNLVNDVWATTVAGVMPLESYLDLTSRFATERDKNVWAVIIDSFAFLNRVIDPPDRPALEEFVRTRIGPATAAVGWVTRSGESDLTRQLRSELIGALGRLGNDPATQARAKELYTIARKDQAAVDPNLLPALVSILAFTGDAARYDEFAERFKTARTPQEERRYLFSLASFRQTALLDRTLTKTLDGGIRTQDAPFIVSAVLGNVYGREQAWSFVKANWDKMAQRFPKQGLRRMCGGITGLCKPELEQDVRTFFADRKIDLGGKTLEQYLEQLRIAVTFRERYEKVLASSLRTALHRASS
ncbi:MAG TPA: M1 family metallopeptidase [Nitrospira sp.]|nr:M1 family metallopeptidase [Nitrospira sp.]